jgi:hypothetical protein
MNEQNKLLRNLPKIDRVLDELQYDSRMVPVAIVKSAVRKTIETFREKILAGGYMMWKQEMVSQWQDEAQRHKGTEAQSF